MTYEDNNQNSERWMNIRPASIGIDEELERLSAGSGKMRILARAAQVKDRYKAVIERIYGKNAPLFLAHTNSVYIMNKDNRRTLIVYVEESIYAADLNARRELMKLLMREMFNEELDVFEIHVSKPKYKKQHPFVSEGDEKTSKNASDAQDSSLTPEQCTLVENVAASVENDALREAIKKAMEANLKVNNGE